MSSTWQSNAPSVDSATAPGVVAAPLPAIEPVQAAADQPSTRRRLLRRLPPVVVLIVFVGGSGGALQTFTNGRLGETFGSPELAACVNGIVSTICLLMLAGFSGAFARARSRLRTGERPRWWHIAVSANTALAIIALAAAAPKVGVALAMVGLVTGQTVGTLIFDRLGLSSAGRRDMTIWRVVGVVLAILAVTIGAFGAPGDLHLELLALLIAMGALFGMTMAGISQVSRTTGEPFVAAFVNSGVTVICATLAALAVHGSLTPDSLSAPPVFWITGGLVSVGGSLIMAIAVRSLGMLRTMLIVIAGQAVGALVIDLIAPPDGKSVTIVTVVSLVLLFVAVSVSNRAPAVARALA